MIYLPDNQETLNIRVESAALIDDGNSAIAITRCESGLGLDITRGMEIFALVKFENINNNKTFDNDTLQSNAWLNFIPGFGVGKFASTGKPLISKFTYELFNLNLRSLVPQGYQLRLEIVFPEGKQLSERTSNSAFGVVDGLALIGTQAEAQVSASPDQLHNTIDELRARSRDPNFAGTLIFVLGENGFDLASSFGLKKETILKIGNWIGPLLVAAGEERVKELLLFGYHGKLVKLAGGIFHTHHHLADARLEILTCLAVLEGLPMDVIHLISEASSMQDALLTLESQDVALVKKLWFRVATEVERKTNHYLTRYISSSLQIGSVLFDRQRNLRWAGPIGKKQLFDLGISLKT